MNQANRDLAVQILEEWLADGAKHLNFEYWSDLTGFITIKDLESKRFPCGTHFCAGGKIAADPRVKELMLSRRGGIAILAPELQTALEIRFPDRYLWSDGYTILALWLDIPRLLSCDIFAPEIETEEYDEGEQIIEANSLERVIKLLKELR